jgi:hypothetical protein
MLFLSSILMAFAWIGHLKYEDTWSFWTALGVSWLIVLPEYLLNVSATRMGVGMYTGAQMASFNMASGVICVAVVSRYFLGEPWAMRQFVGFGLMVVSIFLIVGEQAPSVGH